MDCGAFNGDTLTALADWTGGVFRKAVAFEADPKSFAVLQTVVEGDDRLRGRVRAIQGAVGSAKMHGEICSFRPWQLRDFSGGDHHRGMRVSG